MEYNHKGLFTITKIFSVIFAAYEVVYGLFITFALSFREVRTYSIYGYVSSGTSFDSKIFALYIVLSALFFVFPSALSIMSFKVQQNKKLLLPMLITIIAIMPIGGMLRQPFTLNTGLTLNNNFPTNKLEVASLVLTIIQMSIAVALFALFIALLIVGKESNDHPSKEVAKKANISLSNVSEPSQALETIAKAKELLDSGVLTEKEFKEFKDKLL